MGIKNLLLLLKAITVKSKISSFSGKTAAIDASAWIYKGIYSCVWELARDIPTHGYLNYTIKMVNLLLKNSIKPILVFDGLILPLKENVINKRKLDKVKSKEIAKDLLSKGDKEKAATMFARCMSVKSYMLRNLMDTLHKMKVEYIVAPYEADAQIAYLCREKIADFAVSEDSDLLVYGCQNLVLKLEADGLCENIVVTDTLHNEEYKKSIPEGPAKDIAMLSANSFMDLCIISGCDYLDNIPGFGLKKALKMLKDYTLEETVKIISKKKAYKDKIPEDFLDKVRKVRLQFMHARVIDPRTYTMVECSPLPKDIPEEDAEALGKVFEPALIKPYAQGLYSIRKNTYRERMKDEEIEKMLKEMAQANMQKSFVENKRKGYVKGATQEQGLESYFQPRNGAAKANDEEEKKAPAPAKESNGAKDKENTQVNKHVKREVAERGTRGKRTFYCYFEGDSLVQFFKQHAKRFKEENSEPAIT